MMKVAAFQLRCVGMLMSGGMTMRETFQALGMNQRAMAKHTMRLQDDAVHQMLDSNEGKSDAVKGLLNPAKGIGPSVLNFIHPEHIDEVGPVHRAVLRAWRAGAELADRAFA
jgi:hypothetical protein